MDRFFEVFKAFAWISLCILMAVAIVLFALIYGACSYVLKTFGWKRITFPQIKIINKSY